MAKDLNTSNLGQIVLDGRQLVVDFGDDDRTEITAVAIGGTVVEGVFAVSGSMESIETAGRLVTLPKSMKAREAFLKKWSEKAKANKGC